MNLLFDGLSDTGKVRKRNEDSIRLESDVRLVIVADGMGGYGGGDVASRIACEVVTDAVRAGYQAVDAFREALDEGSPFGRAVQEARLSVMKLLSDAAIEADSCIQRAAADDAATGSEELVGMGSTVVMALFVADRAFVAHVGDSRAYLLRQGVPVRLTSDHSLLQGLVDGGMISQADVARFPMKNVLTRALGVPGTVLPDVIELELAAGDRVLLCSDWLYGLVRDDMIGRLGGTGDLGRCTSKLVAYANAAGGTDNISVVIVEITATDDPGTPAADAANVQAQIQRNIREKSIFRALSTAEWLRLYSSSPRLCFEDGETIFSAGQLGDGMYCVLQGAVDIIRDGRSVHVFGSGTTLSEMSLTEEKIRLVNAVAKGETTVMRLSRIDFLALCDRWPVTANRLLRQLQAQTAASLRDTRDELNIMKVFMARKLSSLGR